MDIRINGITVATPTNYRVERYKITQAERTASGDMVMDVIAKKRKFTLEYAAITGSEMNRILDILDTDAAFFELSYPDRGVISTATVYVGSINQTLHRTDGDWIWTDVEFALIER